MSSTLFSNLNYNQSILIPTVFYLLLSQHAQLFNPEKVNIHMKEKQNATMVAEKFAKFHVQQDNTMDPGRQIYLSNNEKKFGKQ